MILGAKATDASAAPPPTAVPPASHGGEGAGEIDRAAATAQSPGRPRQPGPEEVDRASPGEGGGVGVEAVGLGLVGEGVLAAGVELEAVLHAGGVEDRRHGGRARRAGVLVVLGDVAEDAARIPVQSGMKA